MTAIVLRADTRCLPLPDASVDLIVTSPPYFGLRSYTDGGEHYDGQIGSEATPREWVDAMVECTQEWARVLKPTGSMFVNLGDKYAGVSNGSYAHRNASRDRNHTISRSSLGHGIPQKSLMGLPWRYALSCIDDLGLILRAEIVWSKPNGLPESVTDRVRRSHEQWFHLTKEPRYFSAVDEIREQHTGNSHGSGNGASRAWLPSSGGTNHRALDTDPTEYNPLGKLPGSVWTVPTEPLTVPAHLGVDHFAAFPTAWPKRLIQGWSPSGVCVACGEGRRPTIDKGFALDHVQARKRPGFIDATEPNGNLRGMNAAVRPNGSTIATITGYVCACPDTCAPTRPSVVLDPFGGTGTTALVASALGRTGISVDLSHDYSRLAMWRTRDRAQLAKILEVAKPPTETVGQEAMFGGVA
ncbi:MAG TPA: site-specific DNA-methyltransferase [Acidothermaceae bacterium]